MSLQKAIDYYGNQRKLADALGLKPMAVTQWKKRGVPLRRALEIEKKTHGKIKFADLIN
jgi:DNA-binding transcriptional regulator YdaS (Cro superfamily)